MTQTENYQLSQWAAEDFIQRADFNADNEKIDAALKSAADGVSANSAALALKADAASLAALGETVSALSSGKVDAATFTALAANVGSSGHNARVAFGTYTGTGTYGASYPCTLSPGFYPVLVLICSASDAASAFSPAVLLRGCPKARCAAMTLGDTYSMTLSWTDEGVSWYSTTHVAYQSNSSGTLYYYFVLGYDKTAEEA